MKSMSLILVSLCLLLMIPSLTATPSYLFNICANTTFPANSLYKANLNTVLNSLSTHVAKTHSGFYITESGNRTKDAVYGFYLCRGDQNASSCADCVTTATTTDLPNTYCPTSKVAVIWYDECMVRYSNESLFGKMEVDPRVLLLGDSHTGNVTLFNNVVLKTMNGLVAPTANNQSGIKFTTKMVNFTKSDTLYAMEQCAPDLSTDDCTRCLTIAISRLRIKEGSRTLQPSCYIRYETYPFYIGAVNYSSSILPVLIISHGKKKISSKVIVAIVVPVVVISLIILAIGICLIKKKSKKYVAVPFGSVSEDLTLAESMQYDLATLQSATNNFSDDNKVGEGGFGIVYKGTLADGQVVAVKRLSKTSVQGVQEFKNEVLVVAKLQHRNLVRLLGFCLAGDEKLLVYEYIPNKSLDYFLFDPKKQDNLDWGKRYNIIGGIARGMLYLHQDSRLRIIHRDLKASNILLDGDLNPKISDFGMAKIFGVDQTQGNTSRVVGTYGYMSPEYAMHGQFSVKSDVYSFGVLVLEILSGKKNSSFYESGYAEDLLSYAWKTWKDGTPLELVDETIRDSCSINEVKKCMHLGLMCVQESTDERPTMATVVLMLDNQSISLPMPEQPAFFIRSITESKLGKDIGSDQSTSVPWSMNEVSVSELEPR
ncbi:cysteine-rich receptor-like protein kinase 10 [Silene latifolia]|uniref:cysteine-rich receptor-like protein kinase 10 n=1 Tax=Silene latifolia TaxID=37657 RepID=UPI003D76C157